MGRFYKATSGNFVEDKMFKIPFQEMAAVMGGVDKNIDEAYDQGQEIADTLDSEKLDVDDAGVMARYKYYDDIANAAAADMDKNPLNYRKHVGKLRQASRELSTEMKTGEIGRAQEQFEEFKAIGGELDKRKDLSQEKKDVYKDYLMQQYGSLGYNAETGGHNKIRDNELNLKGGILNEETFMKEVGSTLKAQSQGRGKAEITNVPGIDGEVIKTTTSSVNTISADRVQTAMQGALAARDFRGEREQFYEMKQTIGENGPLDYNDEGVLLSPQDLALRDENELIERGINNLTSRTGHVNETLKSVSSVTGKTIADPRDNFSAEVVDNSVSNAVRIKTKRDNYNMQEVIKAGNIQGYESPQQIVDAVTQAGDKGNTLDAAYKAVSAGGMFKDDKTGFVNWINANHAASVVKEVVPTNVLNTYNKSVQATDTDIYYRNEDNKRTKLPFTNAAQLASYNANSDNPVVWIKVTGTTKDPTPTYQRDSEGYLISKTGGRMQDAKTKKGIKDPALVNKFQAKDMVVQYKDLPSYNNPENMFQAEAGDLRESNQKSVDTYGQVSEDKKYVHTSKWAAINKETNRFEVHSVDLESDINRFPTDKK
jgi:hypothetical protein